MKRGKDKINKQIVQLALFEEQPAQPEQQEEQPEPAPPKKRPRKAKPPEPPAPEKTSLSEEQEASPVAATLLPVEEKLLLQEPMDSNTADKQEAERKVKYKKDQEARLEALRRARGKK